MTIYAFSGLGADARVFDYLKLKYPLVTIKWLPPKSDESLASYCVRIADKIDSKKPFALLGVSFGGLVVSELNKIMSPVLSIIISSVVHKEEIPVLYKFCEKSSVVNFLPEGLFVPSFPIAQVFFKAKNKKLLKAILKDTDPAFAKWAVKKVISWKNKTIPENTIRLHGTEDRLFPLNKQKTGICFINKAGHFMIVDEADKISEYLNNRINKILLKDE